MCLSIYLAKVVGLYLAIVALAMLVHQQRYKKIVTDTLSTPGMLALTGFLGIILGLLLVTSHNVWISSWPVLITLTGWFVLIQGVMRVVFPEGFVRLAKDLQDKGLFTLITWIWLIVGIYLSWMGFTLCCVTA